MTFLKRFKLPVFTGFFLIVLLFSCSEDLTTIGASVIGGTPFNTDKATYDVFAFNRKINAVRTNKLPLYQLGTFNDPIYGKTEASITSQLQLGNSNPTFGIFSQSVEDNPNPDFETQIPENEVVDSVYLYIPYMTQSSLLRDSDGDGVDDAFDLDPEDPNSDWDGDGVTDNEERINGTDPFDAESNDPTIDDFVANNFAARVDIDSIYGDRTMSFNLKVERSTYFLRDLDPNAGFQEAQQYFSTQQFAPAFVSDLLFTGDMTISDEEILLMPLDDPDTSDTDESETFNKLNPGLYVQLDRDFFQENFIDKEGSSELLSQSNFADFMRGIHLSIADDIMFLLDLRNANITVHYSYDRYNTATDVVEEKSRNSTYVLSLLGASQLGAISGNAVNTLNVDPYPQNITDQMDTDLMDLPENDASRIYLKGGAGSYAEIKLFDKANGLDVINEIRSNNWIVNEANLVFYVDEDAVTGAIEPPRIYLYNAETGQIIFNPLLETTESQTIFGLYQNFSGILDEESGAGFYKVRLTDHINNMIVRDSTNATLGLSLTPDIRVVGVRNAMLNNTQNPEEEIPVMNTVTPLGTVLFGGNVEQSNLSKKLKLEIFYTETN